MAPSVVASGKDTVILFFKGFDPGSLARKVVHIYEIKGIFAFK